MYFCKDLGWESNHGFTFAPTDQVKFPSEIAEHSAKRTLGEASKLREGEILADVSNKRLMANLLEPESTQDFVSAVIVKLKAEMMVYSPDSNPKKFQINSFPSPMAYRINSFGNRSPDLPFWSRSNTSSPHCITFLLDVKPCVKGEFTDEQVGHIIDMTCELLTTVQTGRRGMICGLTDGSRFKYFRVLRHGGADCIKVEASRTFEGWEGWQVQ